MLGFFTIFWLRLIDDRDKLGYISISCINCKKETGLYLETSTLEEMISKFVLNTILHHVGISWIISSSNEIKYEMEKTNHPYWLNKGPWYNTATFSRLHGSLFEYFITHARTDRYNLLCSLVEHNKKQPDY